MNSVNLLQFCILVIM